MSNYQKFKQIINPYVTTTNIQRRQESSCFSSLFSACCGGDSSEPENVDRLSADQRAFITGINHIANKINRGEIISPEDFAINASVAVQTAEGENAPLIRRKKISQTNPTGRPYVDFIPGSTNSNIKDMVFKLYLNALYHYLHALNTHSEASSNDLINVETDNEQKFINDLLLALERNFDFVAAEDLATDDDSHNCIAFIKNSIKKAIPLQTRAGQINEVKEAIYRLGGKPAANAATASASASHEQPTSGYGESYGTSYQQGPARPAKK